MPRRAVVRFCVVRIMIVIMIMLVCEMMTDNAAGDRTEHGVMMRKMAGDRADRSALEAAFGLGLSGEQSR